MRNFFKNIQMECMLDSAKNNNQQRLKILMLALNLLQLCRRRQGKRKTLENKRC